MNSHRLRGGACAWLLTLQFFVVETVSQARVVGSYSRSQDVVSALGATTSPAHRLMNASFVVQAALILAGAILLRPALRGAAARVAPILLGVAAAGVLVVGTFPLDGYSTVHAVGAGMYLFGSGIGLIALAYAVRPRSELLGSALAVLGLIGTAAAVFFVAGVTEYLGRGGTERAAVYVLPIGLALTGAALWKLGWGAPEPGTPADGPGSNRREERRLERAQERARQIEQNTARDEALAAAARRTPDGTGTGDNGTPEGGEDPDPDIEADDPWATPGRRRN